MLLFYSHLKEHLKDQIDTNKQMTPEEMEFHYFRYTLYFSQSCRAEQEMKYDMNSYGITIVLGKGLSTLYI